MSGMRDKLSRRGALSALATFALVTAIVVAVPGISSARAAVKQFIASVNPTTASGNTAGSWTETVTNCGGPTLPAKCTAPSTIGLGTIQIAVPTEFRPITSVSTSSPNGRNWTASYVSSTGTINASAVTGADKLQPGEVVNITFGATPLTCVSSTKTFTTAAWGSTSLPGTDPFVIQTSQPTVTITGCSLAPGHDATGPNGTNVTNDSNVTVGISFGGTLTCDSAQWAAHQLPDEVNITPPADPGTDPKYFTFRFDDSGAADSSFYLICYSTSDSGSGTILPLCYPGGGQPLNNPPCVDQQYRDITTSAVTIRIKTPPEDPRAH